MGGGPATVTAARRLALGLPWREAGTPAFENGITNDLTIDYGQFAIKGELTQLDLLPASKCPR